MPNTPEQAREYAHLMYMKHREKRVAYGRKYRAEHMAEHAAASRLRYQRHPGYWAQWSVRRKFGLTMAEWDAMSEAQGGTCAICKQPETRVRHGRITRLCVDHDHRSGVIRALLCHRCNTAIRSLDQSGLLPEVIAYLAYHGFAFTAPPPVKSQSPRS